MKQTAVEWLIEQMKTYNMTVSVHNTSHQNVMDFYKAIEQAKEMESKQLFLASNTSAKDAYKAGQASMYCGCYEYEVCTTYEEWLYENFKSE
jgi:sulfatase maturation enzyme AslB (radical SAM superfamily)